MKNQLNLERPQTIRCVRFFALKTKLIPCFDGNNLLNERFLQATEKQTIRGTA